MNVLLNWWGGHSGGDDYTTYQASASYLTSAGTGLLLTTQEFVLFDFGSDGCYDAGVLFGGRFGSTGNAAAREGGGAAVVATLHAASMSGRIVSAAPAAAGTPSGTTDGGSGFVAVSTHLRAIEALTEYTGRQKPLPEWADAGAIVAIQGGTRQVRQITHKMLAAGVPVAALWLQDWSGRRNTIFGQRLWWNWEQDPETYADWAEMRAEVTRIACITSSNPFYPPSSHSTPDTRYPPAFPPRPQLRQIQAADGGVEGGIRLLKYVNPMFSDVVTAGRNTSRPMLQEALAGARTQPLCCCPTVGLLYPIACTSSPPFYHPCCLRLRWLSCPRRLFR